MTASSVLPVAIAAETATAPVVVRLTRNAPIATPGHNSRPRTGSSAATAIPVGGQMADALAFTNAEIETEAAAEEIGDRQQRDQCNKSGPAESSGGHSVPTRPVIVWLSRLL